MRNCVRVARQTLTLFVWVRILVPQPWISPGIFDVPGLDFTIEVWLSLVERYVRDVEAVCSNHITSTTWLNLDAICVPGSVFYFVSSLAFIVEYLFCQRFPHLRWAIRAPQVFLFLAFVFALKAGIFFINAIQVGVTKQMSPPDFFQYSYGYSGFLGPVFKIAPPWMSDLPKNKKASFLHPEAVRTLF